MDDLLAVCQAFADHGDAVLRDGNFDRAPLDGVVGLHDVEVVALGDGEVHLDRLRKRPNDFDPAVRDRLLAGAMIPAPLVDRAQKFRRWYRARMLEVFASVDVIIAPATPYVAPKIGQTTFVLDGIELPVRANIGIHTQPISFIGLPVVAVPVPLEPLPIGVQVIAAPWREDIALRVAFALERAGVVAAPPPRGF